METKWTNGLSLYCKSMGKVFRVRYVARSTEEANEFTAKHPDTGVIAEDKSGLVLIADLHGLKVRSDVLPE